MVVSRRKRSPPPCIPHEKRTHNPRSDTHTTEYGDAHETLPRDLVVDELAQVGGLEVGGLALEEQVIVAAGLGVAAELIVAESEVVEALAAALGGQAEDLGEEADAELLVVAVVGFYEALFSFNPWS
jgi:hypothetical protein